MSDQGEDDRLPNRPTTPEQMYLAAILRNVQALRSDLDRIPGASSTPPPAAAGSAADDFSPQVVELREPAPAGTLAEHAMRDLPLDFPGLPWLKDAGIFRFEQLPTDRAELEAISGIGRVTADRILEALNV